MDIFKAHSPGCLRGSASSRLPQGGCVCWEPIPWPFSPFLVRVTFQSLPAQARRTKGFSPRPQRWRRMGLEGRAVVGGLRVLGLSGPPKEG